MSQYAIFEAHTRTKPKFIIPKMRNNPDTISELIREAVSGRMDETEHREQAALVAHGTYQR
ncbi:hypothetical protein [Phyllobacterium zundukense]|uniref:Uncharacterized protein n=1 Tax=Phyllobacterium zundukense TaxID=1867719 RepID=A0A2N9W0M2_9HYPH|nr:hypothetical protein [Phyllobacterium zundukense]ATU95463.1 hypothetical protein BLM14_27670 [Phyllobacterium zundukense]PIO45290.1 hypothetical protein B5P45_08520 [Phyllobacterium zundukense]